MNPPSIASNWPVVKALVAKKRMALAMSTSSPTLSAGFTWGKFSVELTPDWDGPAVILKRVERREREVKSVRLRKTDLSLIHGSTHSVAKSPGSKALTRIRREEWNDRVWESSWVKWLAACEVEKGGWRQISEDPKGLKRSQRSYTYSFGSIVSVVLGKW